MAQFFHRQAYLEMNNVLLKKSLQCPCHDDTHRDRDSLCSSIKLKGDVNPAKGFGLSRLGGKSEFQNFIIDGFSWLITKVNTDAYCLLRKYTRFFQIFSSST